MNDNLPEDTRQNGGAAAWAVIALMVWLAVGGCIVAKFDENGAKAFGYGSAEVNGNKVSTQIFDGLKLEK